MSILQFSRHSRAGGNPTPELTVPTDVALGPKGLELGSRLRGNDDGGRGNNDGFGTLEW